MREQARAEFLVEFLNKLDTKRLVERLAELETQLENAMLHEADYKYQNASYLSGYNSDSRSVEEIMASLIPPTDKKTVDQRKAWLLLQRKENNELAAAIKQQHEVAFHNEQNRIEVEMLNRKLEGVRVVLRLKTQQIAFLASDFLKEHHDDKLVRFK